MLRRKYKQTTDEVIRANVLNTKNNSLKKAKKEKLRKLFEELVWLSVTLSLVLFFFYLAFAGGKWSF